MEKSVTRLATDYLVIGAGAMGMSFLEELITNSPSIEAIIVDTRSAPGGHWNDAYSFVRLHQPALTYGVNSRTLGAGGADLASKVLILEHYELALKDLIATGRVKFFPQCKYLGDGRLVSLLDDTIEYKVDIRKKLVDATCTVTHVPATKKPNYKVDDNVNLIPINGLSSISSPFPHYLIIGGGKTGIDAALFLLDNNVKPEKISWIVPNDAWFWNREINNYDDGHFNDLAVRMVDAIIDEKNQTVNDVLLGCEEKGITMRLDKNIMPTRYRAATVSRKEIEKLQKIKNIIRKGRIDRIESGKLIFQSGEEMDFDAETICVDCSVNSTMFGPKKQVFDGDTINVQFIRLPPPGISANIIAALELKYPNDEEKKNSICVVLDVPQMPIDFIKNMYTDSKTSEAAIKDLGFRWSRKRRNSVFHHLQLLDLIKLMVKMGKKRNDLRQKLELLMKQN